MRSECINTKSSIDYNLLLKTPKSDQYEGLVNIEFDIQKIPENLSLDYYGSSIESLTINNKAIYTYNQLQGLFDGNQLRLPSNNLVNGQNRVCIEFKNDYSTTGNGLHSFIDSTDKQQYIYSNCEPYYMNHVFPCFDQPDLKGIFKLKVIAPNEWKVISNEKLISKMNLINLEQQPNFGEIYSFWQNEQEFIEKIIKNTEQYNQLDISSFRSTPRLSTYLYCIIAGAFRELEAKKLYRDIPMSLYCRDSLYSQMKRDADEIFEVTRESLKFYEKYFHYDYPFSKYDQIFCPEFNVGAMEHPGAVTFNDLYIFREDVPLEKRVRRANTISHEISHMWFGNLVTMKWWNDLWLNESFADYISHYCLAQIYPLETIDLKNIWLEFLLNKGWAYREDQLTTTHPIAGSVLNTEQAEMIFDGITYSKGAATMKQLMYLIGQNNFSEAIGYYFNKYAWRNATFDDFVNAMSKYSDESLQKYRLNLNLWKNQWICTAGLNEFTIDWSPEQPTKITIKQHYALEQHQTLRFHKTKIALFNKNAQIIEVLDILLPNQQIYEVNINNNSEEIEAILLNYSDEAYMKIILDEYSSSFFLENLHKIQDNLSKGLIWRSLWDSVRDGKVSSLKFLESVLNILPHEQNDQIISIALSYVTGVLRNFIPQRISRDRQLYDKYFDMTLNMLRDSLVQGNTNKCTLLRDKLIEFSKSKKNVEFLMRWLDNNELNNVELGVNSKWACIIKIYQNTDIDIQIKQKYLNIQVESDKSDFGLRVIKRCQAIILTKEQRKVIWDSFINHTDIRESVKSIEATMNGFNDENQVESLQYYYQEFFKNVVFVFENQSKEYAQAFFRCLFPQDDHVQRNLELTQNLILNYEGNIDWLKKLLLEARDDLLRKQKAFEKLKSDI